MDSHWRLQKGIVAVQLSAFVCSRLLGTLIKHVWHGPSLPSRTVVEELFVAGLRTILEFLSRRGESRTSARLRGLWRFLPRRRARRTQALSTCVEGNEQAFRARAIVIHNRIRSLAVRIRPVSPKGYSYAKAVYRLDGPLGEPWPFLGAEPPHALKGIWVRTQRPRHTAEHEDGRRVVLYLHGGGYCFLSPDAYASLGAWIATRTKAPVFLLDYRLAPEAVFPAALDDALATYQLLCAPTTVGGYGYAPSSIAIAGDSAGGGLTMALLLRLRELGLPQPACAFLMSPWVDLTCSRESWVRNELSDYLPCLSGILDLPRLYVGGVDKRLLHNPLVSPLFADDFRGLPPILQHVGGAERLLDENVELADKLRQSSVDVHFNVFKDMFHVFHIMNGIVPAATLALDAAGTFISHRLRDKRSEAIVSVREHPSYAA